MLAGSTHPHQLDSKREELQYKGDYIYYCNIIISLSAHLHIYNYVHINAATPVTCVTDLQIYLSCTIYAASLTPKIDIASYSLNTVISLAATILK